MVPASRLPIITVEAPRARAFMTFNEKEWDFDMYLWLKGLVVFFAPLPDQSYH